VRVQHGQGIAQGAPRGQIQDQLLFLAVAAVAADPDAARALVVVILLLVGQVARAPPQLQAHRGKRQRGHHEGFARAPHRHLGARRRLRRRGQRDQKSDARPRRRLGATAALLLLPPPPPHLPHARGSQTHLPKSRGWPPERDPHHLRVVRRPLRGDRRVKGHGRALRKRAERRQRDAPRSRKPLAAAAATF
jgi:hypothetical protein